MTALVLSIAGMLFAADRAAASGAPTWSIEQLATFADVIVSARIEAVTPAWDSTTNTIYTYVTISVDRIFKGPVPQQRIVIKQLGGRVGTVGLHVADQADFRVGEESLLFLEARPRDGTLYTSALWQGKWSVDRDAAGREIVTRQLPEQAIVGEADRQTMVTIERSIAKVKGLRPMATNLQFEPAVVSQPAQVNDPLSTHAFTLLGPLRYLFSPPIDVQAGGQPGLAGGGVSEILSALGRWNNAGSKFRYGVGTSNAAPRCTTEELGNGHITISFMDPCNEMSNSGGTLAIGGSYYFFGGAGTTNGAEFNRASEGFIVTNDGDTALRFLTQSGCFEDVQTHELGHVLGLGHSTDPRAVMFPSINSTCDAGPKALADDDIAGLNFIYGPGTTRTTVLAAPTRVQVAVNGTVSVTVSWQAGQATAPDAPDAISYRVDFYREHRDGGPLFASLTTAATALTVAIPRGLVGDFNAVVTPVDAAGDGPSSFRTDFSLCTNAPPALENVQGFVGGGRARVRWLPVAGATSYTGSVGSVQGAADVYQITNVGSATEVESAVDPGFEAWIRIYAINACGASAPFDFFLQERIEQ